jgi:predicted transcriptional regulator
MHIGGEPTIQKADRLYIKSKEKGFAVKLTLRYRTIVPKRLISRNLIDYMENGYKSHLG